MRIEIKLLTPSSHLVLPISHNHILQGFIYSLMEASLRRRIHEEGFQYEKRKFRLFTFSRLYGKFKKKNGTFCFNSPVKLIIASSQNEILQSIAENLVKGEHFYIGENETLIESIAVLPRPHFKDKIIIKMLSPLTCYSTLKKGDGKIKTYYYSPFEEEFSTLIRENLRKKYKVVFGSEKGFDFNLRLFKVRPQDEKVIIYNRSDKEKGTIIKGWMGLYELTGSLKTLRLSYDTGIGAKNSQGFGCWEAMEQ